MSELRFPTFSFSGFTSDVPTAEWQAARQALGIALRDDVTWFKETWAGSVYYDGIGVYSYDFENLDDGLNSLDTSYNFKVILANSSSSISRHYRAGVAVDRNLRTFVIATGDRNYGDDKYGLMIVAGEHAEEVSAKISNKCNGALSKRGERLISHVECYSQTYAEGTPVAFYYIDLVRLVVRAGNPLTGNSMTEFKIDRW